MPTQVLDQVRSLEKELASLKGKLASAQGDELLSLAVDVKGLKVLAAQLQGADAKTLRDTLDKLKDKLKTSVIVLASVEGGKVQIAAGVSADVIARPEARIKAGELVNFVAQQVGGKGGGKPDMAMAGGTDPTRHRHDLQTLLQPSGGGLARLAPQLPELRPGGRRPSFQGCRFPIST